MLDAAASSDHARLFLDALKAENVTAPQFVALTHWHWDHIFGAHELNLPIIAHMLTAEQIAIQSRYSWTDAALDQRVADGTEIAFCADNIKLELPEPRDLKIVLPHIVFQDPLDIHLGGVSVHVQHVGGDHAHDACVMHIMPDKVLFLGDCLYDAIYTPIRHYTTRRLFPLLDTIFSFDAEYYIEGHTPTVMTRAELVAMTDNMRLIGGLVDELGGDAAAVTQAMQAHTGLPPDEDTLSFIEGFVAGYKLT